MDWIKIQVTLPRCPKVVKLAKLMGVSRHEALGMAVEWFAWLDGVTEDGRTGLTPAEIEGIFCCNARSVTDGNAGVCTFCDALCEIGWAEVDENGEINAVNYENHNGKSAKKRAQTAERVRKMRKKNSNARSVTNVTQKALPEKRREEKIYNEEIPSEPYTTVCGGATATQRPCKNITPESAEEVQAFMAAQAVCGLQGDELATCAMAFFNDCEAVGWTHKGQPIRDWQAACRAFLARWQQNKAQRAGAAPAASFTFRSSKKQNYDL